MRNQITNKIRNLKYKFYKNKILEADNDPKIIWNSVKELTTGKKVNKKIENVTEEDGTEILKTETQQIANRFNKFFSNVGKEMASKINMPGRNNPFMSRTNIPSFTLTETNEEEVIRIIKNLKESSSPGEDGIGNGIIKKYKDLILKPLTLLLNRSLNEGIFPDTLKPAIIIPIFKKGNRKEVTNYRPISLTSTIAKILEKIFKHKLIKFIEESNYLSNFQFGFRNARSTQDAIVRVVSQIYDNFDKNEKALAIFIDLQKAFDSISHEILLQKIEKAGIRGISYNFIKSYLKNRTQRVKIENVLSNPEVVTFGVPQGTVLGPILFILYINDMFDLPLKGSLTCFADDTSYNISAKTWREVYEYAERDINIIKEWMDYNLLSMNISKTNFITFSINTLGQPPTDFKLKVHTLICNNNMNVNCGCHPLIKVSSIMYLGVKIDENLNWKEHAATTAMRIRRTGYIFRELRNFLDLKTIRSVYFALTHSILQYAIAAWGATYPTYLIPVKSAIQIVLRIALKKHYRYHSEFLYQELNVPTMEKTHAFSLLCLTSLYTPYHLTLPPPVLHGHDTRLRSNNTLSVYQVNRSITYNSPAYVAGKLFNILPNSIKLLRYSKSYRLKLKEWVKDNEIPIQLSPHNFVL